MLLSTLTASIVCDSGGAAEVYAGLRVSGRVHAIKYTYGTLAAGTDLEITGETTGVTVFKKDNVGAANAWFYPRAGAVAAADGSAISGSAEPVRLLKERIKIVAAQGGSGGSGTITFYIDND